jgi:plasmid stabilization system protein ParE
MSVRLRILDSVYEDIADVLRYYDSESQSAGDRFLENIDSIYENISDFPLMYPVRYDDVHLAVLTKFPYAVHYTYDHLEATVFAIRNTKQDPRNLPKRN